jgi:hypothetical protein
MINADSPYAFLDQDPADAHCEVQCESLQSTMAARSEPNLLRGPFSHAPRYGSRSQDIVAAAAELRASVSTYSSTATFHGYNAVATHPEAPKPLFEHRGHAPSYYLREETSVPLTSAERSKETIGFAYPGSSASRSSSGDASPLPVKGDQTPRSTLSGRNETSPWLRDAAFIVNTCLAQFLSLAALAQTVAPLLIIGADLQVTDPGLLSWFMAAFSLTLGTMILPAGRLGDMLGHKYIFMLGWAWFAAWSLITGFSYTSGHVMLSACRAFQGIGPALTVPNAMALIARTYPPGLKRNLVLSAFGACGPTGFVVGATFSSLFAQLACEILSG